MTDLMRTVLILSASGTALALVLAALRRLLRNRLPKAVLYYLWLLVLLRLAIPAALPVSLPQTALSRLPVEQQASVHQTGTPAPVPAVDAAQPVPEELVFHYTPNAVITGSGLPLPEQHSRQTLWYRALWQWLCAHFAAVWLTGAALHFLWFASAYRRYRRQLLEAGQPLQEHEQALLEELRAGRRVTALRSAAAQTPLLVGLCRPCIVLPETPVSTLELECILRHELAHLARRDMLYKWFAVAVTSFHWFNPLMPWLRRELSRSCELACDEAVIRTMDGEHRRLYGETLLSMAAARALPRGVPATMLCEETRQLKERLQGILRHKKLTAAIVLLSLLLALGVAGCAAVLGPQWEEEAEAPSVTGPLTAEQQAPVLEAIKAWAEENVTCEGTRSLTYYAPDGTPGALGFFADIGDTWLYDLSEHTVRAIDGTYPDTADLGYVCLSIGEDDDTQFLVTFYLTRSERGRDGDPIAALTRLAEQYPAAKTGYLGWNEQNGRPAYVMCYFRQDGQEYTFQYSDICGFWSVQPREQDSGRWAAVAVTDLPRTMAAITDWQRTHAESPDDRRFQLTLHTSGLEAMADHAWPSRLFCDLSTGALREGAPDETGQNLCAAVSLLQCEDPDARVWLLESTSRVFPSEAELAGKEYYYAGDLASSSLRGLSPFCIQLLADGTFQYREHLASSWMGTGVWMLEGDIVTLLESDTSRSFRFRAEGDALYYLAGRSDAFTYVELPDGAVFYAQTALQVSAEDTLYSQTAALVTQEFHRVYEPYYDILSLELSDWQQEGDEATFTCVMTWQQYERDVTQVPWLKQYEGTDGYQTMCQEYLARKTGSFLLRVTKEEEMLTLYTDESVTDTPSWTKCRIDDFNGKTTSQRMYAAYGHLLWDVYDRGLLPDGTALSRFGEPENSSFALADVDGDGSTELILSWQEGAVADVLLAVYGWRDGYLYEQGRFFPQVHFYSNGTLAVEWSHNQGPSAKDFWPYDAYSYDPVSDTWQRVGSIDSNGQRYYLLPADWDGTYSDDLLTDEADYLAWRKSWLQESAELVLAEQALTAETIADLGAPRPSHEALQPVG